MLSLNSLPKESTYHVAHSSPLLRNTSFAFDDSEYSTLPASPASDSCDLPIYSYDVSAVSTPSSSFNRLPSPLPLSWSFTTSSCCAPSSSELLTGDGDGFAALSSAAGLPSLVKCVMPLHSSVSLSVAEEKPELTEPLEEKIVRPFVSKLSNMMRDPSSAGLIFWSRDGLSLVVLDEYSIVACLEKHYHHSHFISFVRQLNYYGFTKKTTSVNSTGSKPECNSEPGGYFRQCITFTHPSYRRNREDLLHLILRKRSGEVSRAAGDDQFPQLSPAEPLVLRRDGTVSDHVLISNLRVQTRQLFVQHKQLTRSQKRILLRLEGMLRHSDQQPPTGEEAPATTKGDHLAPLKKRK
jgi:hypothetical protein